LLLWPRFTDIGAPILFSFTVIFDGSDLTTGAAERLSAIVERLEPLTVIVGLDGTLNVCTCVVVLGAVILGASVALWLIDGIETGGLTDLLDILGAEIIGWERADMLGEPAGEERPDMLGAAAGDEGA